MTGQSTWFSLAILIVASSPVVALWVSGWVADRKYRVEHRHVRCRVGGNQLADCTVVRDAGTNIPIGIRSCSVQPNPEMVRCGRACLPMFTH